LLKRTLNRFSIKLKLGKKEYILNILEHHWTINFDTVADWF
jgi:hypothetical protein